MAIYNSNKKIQLMSPREVALREKDLKRNGYSFNKSGNDYLSDSNKSPKVKPTLGISLSKGIRKKL